MRGCRARIGMERLGMRNETIPRPYEFPELVAGIVTEMINRGASTRDIATELNIPYSAVRDFARSRGLEPIPARGVNGHGQRKPADTDGVEHLHNACRRFVALAVQLGIIEPAPICESCGTLPQPSPNCLVGLAAHHDDYNRPLSVRWLCAKCHHGWHRRNRPKRANGVAGIREQNAWITEGLREKRG